MPPAPKRRSERRRRNIVVGETVTSITGPLNVPQPPLPETEYFSPNAERFYASLSESGQALHYEPSDWALAGLVASWITDYDIAIKPPITLLRYILDGMATLMVSEGARRRVHMELERAGEEDDEVGEGVTAIEDYRKKLAGQK
jgi:hypothetical protein